MSVSFGKNDVLKELSLRISKGSKVSIIGPSGSGKSTLLRCIYGFQKIRSGKIIINNDEIFKLPKKELYKARQNIGMVFQQFNLYPQYSVLENLMLAPVKLKKENKPTAKKRALDMLASVGLESKVDEFPAKLSGGQQQRVAIARALMMQPQILLLDEPTSALDPEMTKEVLKIIEEVAKTQEITMVCVTHEMRFAERFSDRIIFLDEGKVVIDGTPQEVFHSATNLRAQEFIKSIL